MTPLETHSADEIDRALDRSAPGSSASTHATSTPSNSTRICSAGLADHIPSGVIRVAESAVKSAEDIAHYRRAGADVVLVGEALVTGDPVQTLAEFLAA